MKNRTAVAPSTRATPAPPSARRCSRSSPPDLGVTIVDLGFVRTIPIAERTAVITMTLTSAACPLTGVMEDQIRAELADRPEVDDFRVDWVWLPLWRPDDVTEADGEQVCAIGFTI